MLGLIVPGFVSIAEEPEALSALGLIPSPAGDYPQANLSVNADALPEAADWSDWMPPVRSQGRQASCVAWATAYYYRSYQEGIERDRVPASSDDTFSPAFIYNQRSTRDCGSDQGMTMLDGLRIAVDQGVPSMAAMPYRSSDTCTQPSDEAREEASRHRAVSYLNLFLGQGRAHLDGLKAHLVAGDPFLLAVPVYSEFRRVSRDDAVIDVPAQGSTYYGGHAVLVVGYDDVSQTFKFVNSWGITWGEKGYGYLTYDFVQQETWEGWALVDMETTPPALPEQAYELGGATSGIGQSQIDSPVFAWEAAESSSTVYYIYWGPDPEGTEEMTTTDTIFSPGPMAESSIWYLRLKAEDAAGICSEWGTLFEFKYQQPQRSSQAMILRPTLVLR
jgi:C1A family cysteine protease